MGTFKYTLMVQAAISGSSARVRLHKLALRSQKPHTPCRFLTGLKAQ
jgi:hypothetical protein